METGVTITKQYKIRTKLHISSSLNKEYSSKFTEGYPDRQISEEDRSAQRLKRSYNNINDSDISSTVNM